MKTLVKNYITLTIASLLMGISVSQFIVPNGIAPGGATGLSVLINALIPVSVDIILLLINIPGIVIGLISFGWKFSIATIYCSMMMSVFIRILSIFPAVTSDPILAAVFGGVILGLGVGITFRNDAMSGGFDFIVLTIQQKWKHIRISIVFMYINIAIILTSAVVFGNFEFALYAAICNFCLTKAVDFIMYEPDVQRVLIVITSMHESLAKKLTVNQVGFTFIDGQSPYHGENIKIILCAIKKHRYPDVKAIINSVDSSAFTITMLSSDIYGENFKSYKTVEM